MLEYKYTHDQTTSTTGFFSCVPTQDSKELTIEQSLTLLEQTPNDSFLHRYLLKLLLNLSSQQIDDLLLNDKNAFNQTKLNIYNAILTELVEIKPALLSINALKQIQQYLDNPEHKLVLSKFSPLIYLQAKKEFNVKLQNAWRKIFLKNITAHNKIPSPEEINLPPLYLNNKPSWDQNLQITLPELHNKYRILEAENNINPQQTLTPKGMGSIALERLNACGIIAGAEMRHQASLSPIALQRLWNINLEVNYGKHNYTLKGQANTYGRGLHLDIARVSCLMEMVERASAYASISPKGILNKQENAEIFYATSSELLEKGHEVIDFKKLNLEVNYQNQALHFIKAEYPYLSDIDDLTSFKTKPILVPMQLVYLFNNLDEPDLCDAPSSTGLAASSSLVEAKISAITEVLERDAEATNIYHKKFCFNIQNQDPELLQLFNTYKKQGINVQFQDLTSPLGFPCVKCFVIGNKGQIYRATGANLDAKRALIAALTETPFPFPEGPASGPGLRSLEQVDFKLLPSYRLNSPELTLKMLEELLIKNGLTPIYINLTRSDLDLPVIKVIIPELYTNAELDETNIIPYRLCQHYINTYKNI